MAETSQQGFARARGAMAVSPIGSPAVPVKGVLARELEPCHFNLRQAPEAAHAVHMSDRSGELLVRLSDAEVTVAALGKPVAERVPARRGGAG